MLSRPRIIINDRCLRGPRTGVGHYLAELLEHLPREAPDLEFYAFYRSCLARYTSHSSAPDRKSDHDRAAGEAHARFGEARPAGRTPSLGRRPPWWLRRAALNLYNTAFRWVGQLKGCRLYHEPNHIPAPWPGPIVTTIHDLSVLRHPEWHPADRVRWYARDFQAGLERTSHFITVSEFTRQEMIALANLPADRITVIPLGVREVFHPRPADEVKAWLLGSNLPEHYLLYAGTIEPRKNVPGLLAAYARLPQSLRRQVHLLLAGVTGWGRQTVDEWIDRHALRSQVRVLGYVDDEVLARLYAGAKALVWPTLYEGFGLPPLECMACGTPVITSRLASLPEVTGQAALLVDPQDIEALSDGMIQILEDRLLADRLRTAGLDRAAQFTWPRSARQHADLYRRILRERS